MGWGIAIESSSNPIQGSAGHRDPNLVTRLLETLG